MKSVLCFGDSNTYGLKPDGSGRFEKTERWTGVLSEMLGHQNYEVIEEGLVGRTTVFEDSTRQGRNGSKLLPILLESHGPVDTVVVMLGTNDCKAVYNASPKLIARGAEILLRQIRDNNSAAKILLLSPIHLGDTVWKEEFDPEFDEKSVITSKELKAVFAKLAEEFDCMFLAASDVAKPSETDQEHLDEKGHLALANAIYKKLVAA
ncbi:MAG: arylesterase [Pseudobutyrivibrio sp.]|uniref:SGNH/GDSL hydrolase family protein n=1 Tax=unclassified Pseudobutyrivibrio TaxID=2638619 RepID=UPI00088A5887|nr:MULTISPECIES: SGNH/GDSL hydrolase family protein [unclassified Pseudobutyrivibrio]MBE5904849.1 arylesterase [Pseudobutyrivibrio sp.]SCY39766.1 Lysophospholipase L1 [Pseudobutyrivibrio sp. AR14]